MLHKEEVQPLDERAWVAENTIHKILAGSHLYGTSRPESDEDIRGVCLMPRESLVGLQDFEQYQKISDGDDIVIYGLTKFFQLSLDANPNIMDILCTPPARWLVHTGAWQRIYDHRRLFLSQKARHTFSGYAVSQLKRLQRHYEWLTNPPDHRPRLEDFGGRLEQDPKGGQKKTFPHQDAQSRYEAAERHWKQYQHWLENRNPARAALEARYGYDTKHAGHLVRLMVKAVELLETGDYDPVLVGEQLEIVRTVQGGGWTYPSLIDWARDMDARVHGMTSALPRRPDRAAAEGLLMDINLASLAG